MKKNWLKVIILAVVVLFTLTACGTKTGVVSYANYTSIVLVADATDTTPATTYAGVVILLGAPTDDTNMASGTGYATWVSDEYSVRVDFDTNLASVKTQTGLYESVYKTPIGEKTGVWEWIILQIGTFTYHASNLFGLLGNTYIYAIGLLIMTLVIRTLGWPIYAKSNDMTVKMQIAQPELDKIQQKYAGRTDQATQQRMQMETMEIYKKYKINVLGCLMPFLQMPIFIAMYQVVQRFPLTDESVFGGITGVMRQGFLWTNLGNTFVFNQLFDAATSSAAWSAFFQNLPLAIIVGATMFLSQWLTTQRQKASQRPNRYQSAQAQQTAKTMKYMMYFMTFMMAYIALGNAGIAFYWIIGNCYQLFQSEVSHRQMLAKKEKLAKNI
jgi:YidC/Oxa1 family membrane protein insertase